MIKSGLKQPTQARDAHVRPRHARLSFHRPGSGLCPGREDWLEGLFAHVADAIYVHDLKGRMLDANPAASETFGYSRAELLALHPWEIVTNSSRQEMLALWQEVTCGWRVTVERSYRRKDGEPVLAEVRLTRAHSSEGDFIIALCRDVTAQRRVEEALRASEQLARGQVEALRHALDAVARDAAPERFLVEILRTLSRMLRAQPVSLWLQDELSPVPRFQPFPLARTDSFGNAGTNHAATDALPEHPLTSDVFRSRSPVLCGELERDSRFELNRRCWVAEGVRIVLAVPLLVAGKVMGLVSISSSRRDGYRPDEIELAQALAQQAALAVQLSRLAAHRRQLAVLEERNRVARDIHDTLAQGLTGTVVQLEAAKAALANGRTDETADRLDQACELTRGSLRAARRSVQALRDPALIGGDLPTALENLFQQMTQGTGLRARLVCAGEPRELPPEWQSHLLHIGREALTNTIKHAHASRFDARLRFASGEIRFALKDNGHGFDPRRVHSGFGLTGLRERVERMGGRLAVESVMGAGTGIRVAVPATAA